MSDLTKLTAARNRIDDDTETINRQCKELGRLRERLEQCEAALKDAKAATANTNPTLGSQSTYDDKR